MRPASALALNRHADVSAYIIAYLIAFADDVFPYTAWEVIFSTLLGIFYLGFFFKEDSWFNKNQPLSRRCLYFVVQFSLAFGVQLILRFSGMTWLITMPLVGSMANALTPLPRRIGYSAIVLGVYIP